MTPATTTARRAPATRRTRPAQAPARRPPLRVVPPAPRHRAPRRRLVPLLSVAMIVGSLAVVVVGHAVLAEGQVRLSAATSELAAAQAVNGHDTLELARLESPARIVGEATGPLHMVSAGAIVQLPNVSLATPLPTPTVGPAPASATARS